MGSSGGALTRSATRRHGWRSRKEEKLAAAIGDKNLCVFALISEEDPKRAPCGLRQSADGGEAGMALVAHGNRSSHGSRSLAHNARKSRPAEAGLIRLPYQASATVCTDWPRHSTISTALKIPLLSQFTGNSYNSSLLALFN